MAKLMLSLHVVVAIVAVGSITVAASMFPRVALQALGLGRGGGGENGGVVGGDGAGADSGDATAVPDRRSAGVAALLHRICVGYAIVGIAVPLFGVATAAQLGVLTDAWLIVSIVLTLAVAVLLGLAILPRQRALLALAGEDPDAGALPAAPAHGSAPAEGSAPAGAPAPDARSTARRTAARLSMLTGVFNLLWVIVVILMIIRPGSTTGV